jgi:hypothetical protein
VCSGGRIRPPFATAPTKSRTRSEGVKEAPFTKFHSKFTTL